MCTTPSRALDTRPLIMQDAKYLANWYGMDPKLVNGVYDALTDHLHVKRPAFVAIIDLLWRATEAGEVGFTGFGPNLLYSACDRSGTLLRYQAPVMAIVDDAMGDVSRAERNKLLLNDHLARYRLVFVENCCCGGAVVRDGTQRQYFESEWYKESNRYRSLANVMGTTIETSAVDEIPEGTEITQAIKDAYARILLHLGENEGLPFMPYQYLTGRGIEHEVAAEIAHLYSFA